MNQRPKYSSTPWLVVGWLVFVVLTIPIVIAFCAQSPPPEQPVRPKPSIPPSTLLPTPAPTITSVVIVGPAPPTGVPMPPPILVPTAQVTATLPSPAPTVVAPTLEASPVPTETVLATVTPLPTPTAIFKPAPVQIPRGR